MACLPFFLLSHSSLVLTHQGLDELDRDAQELHIIIRERELLHTRICANEVELLGKRPSVDQGCIC